MAGPPPYTLEQINALTTKEERTRAEAELKSYIARMKREKQEKQEREMEQTAGPGSPRNLHSGPSPSPQRGGVTYGGIGYRAHPYQRARSQYIQQKFKNKSVTFSNPDSGAESSDANEAATASPGRTNNLATGQGSDPQAEASTLCSALTSTGICSRRGCRHIHDATKLALCKRWLYKGECSKGEYCNLSHESSPNNAPTCLHFQDGGCNNDDCHFAHIRISPIASNCEQFGRLGYCEKGNSCAERHAHECPSFANTGACPSGDKCRLGHVHRASRMRSIKRSSSVDAPSTLKASAGEDEQEAVPIVESKSVHEFTRQDDFVPFDADD